VRLLLGALVAALAVRWTAANLSHVGASASSYRETRIATAFAGLPVDALAAALDSRLEPAVPVRLGDSLRRSRLFDYGWLEQRLTEGLYPRIVAANAPHCLEIVAGAPAAALASLPDGWSIVLQGPNAERGPARPRVVVETPSAVAMLLRALALFGLGRLLGRALPARRSPPSRLESLLAGILAVALVVHLAVWLGLAVPWTALLVVGLVGCLVPQRGVATREPAPPRDRTTLALETLLIAALAVFAARTLFVPVTRWDGRSIWLFHARQVALSQSPGAAIASVPDSQPTYPLLLPAHLAFFGLQNDAFNERAAAASLALLFAACVCACWTWARLILGRAGGAVFALAALVGTADLSGEAYADGFLALLLAATFLSSMRPGPALAPVLAMAAAGLAKREGLVLALLVHLAGRGGRGLGTCALALAPAALHAAWASWHGLPHDFDRLPASASMLEPGERLYWILRIGARNVIKQDFLMLGFLAALLVLAALATRRVSWRSLAGRSAAACLALLAFALLAFLSTPQPLAWHLDTAFGRLLLHPALFAVLALIAGEWPARDTHHPG
jgi:hypothetical protein